jgi:hypothetical protein
VEAELRVIFATLVVVAFATSSAHAAPGIPPKGSPVELSITSLIELARDGCGRVGQRVFWPMRSELWGEGAFLPPLDEGDDFWVCYLLSEIAR